MGYHIDTRAGGGDAACGDFAEHVDLDACRSAIFVGDVAGRGPAAGRAARMLQSYVRAALHGTTSLAWCLQATDSFFTRGILSDATPFASLFVAIIDAGSGSVSYASAGHEPALLFDDAGRHRHLEPTGPILGLQALGTQAFRERRLPPLKDGLLVIVTDGITEARRANGCGLELFGSTGVVRAVQRAERDGRDTATAIHQAAEDHAHGVLVDDACVAVSAVTAGVTVPASAVMRSTPEPYLSLRPERGSSNRRRWLLPVARGRAS
jgi:serine phosphatase RsbU (regulator of sigma subunit)